MQSRQAGRQAAKVCSTILVISIFVCSVVERERERESDERQCVCLRRKT
jgi:hypothetical protein